MKHLRSFTFWNLALLAVAWTGESAAGNTTAAMWIASCHLCAIGGLLVGRFVLS